MATTHFSFTDEKLATLAEPGCDSSPPPPAHHFFPQFPGVFKKNWQIAGLAPLSANGIRDLPWDMFKTMMQFLHVFNIHLNSVFGFFFLSREHVYMYLQFGLLCVKLVQLVVELLHHRVNSFRQSRRSLRFLQLLLNATRLNHLLNLVQILKEQTPFLSM